MTSNWKKKKQKTDKVSIPRRHMVLTFMKKNGAVTSFPMALIFSIASRNNLSAVFQLKKQIWKTFLQHISILNKTVCQSVCVICVPCMCGCCSSSSLNQVHYELHKFEYIHVYLVLKRCQCPDRKKHIHILQIFWILICKVLYECKLVFVFMTGKCAVTQCSFCLLN